MFPFGKGQPGRCYVAFKECVIVRCWNPYRCVKRHIHPKLETQQKTWRELVRNERFQSYIAIFLTKQHYFKFFLKKVNTLFFKVNTWQILPYKKGVPNDWYLFPFCRYQLPKNPTIFGCRAFQAGQLLQCGSGSVDKVARMSCDRPFMARWDQICQKKPNKKQLPKDCPKNPWDVMGCHGMSKHVKTDLF